MRSCLLDALASAWVDLYHAAFVSRHTLAKEQEQIRVALVQRELAACQQQLQKKEVDLQSKFDVLGREALARKQSRDLLGAKKKMLERRRIQAQLEKLQNSIMTIDMHKSTIEGSVLDRTVLETLRASGDALRQIGASTAGLRAVEEIVSDAEAQMENAAEITKILSAASVTGMVNTMAIDGIPIDEDELMKELDELVFPSDQDNAEKQQMTDPLLKLPSVVSNASTGFPLTTEAAARSDMTKNKMPIIAEEEYDEQLSAASNTSNVKRLLHRA